jgi:vitamin B12 transporter
VIVTARRSQSTLSQTPQKVEVIAQQDIERSVAQDLTDALKKNSSVDVIQYNGILSGIGIRGFRPEFEFAINKRSLLLIDGRPAGSTNLSTVLLDNVERIEVQKGPASALYGPSAMGGVVNVITKRRRGEAISEFTAGYGSFDRKELSGASAGGLGNVAYYAITARRLEQDGDYRTGNGETRPFTRFSTNHATARFGHDLSTSWTLEGSGEFHQDRDVLSPGSDLNGTAQQSSKDLDRSSLELRLTGTHGEHRPTMIVYQARERADLYKVESPIPADLPFLPFRQFASDIDYFGVQLRNDWAWSDQHNLLLGIDYDDTDSASQSFGPSADGSRIEERLAFFRDNRRLTTGVFAQNTLRFREGRTVLEVGARFDRIEVETFATPLAPTFEPSSTSVDRFSPSVGFKQELWPGIRVHGTAGRGFVVPEAGQLTGFNRQRVGDRDRVTQGNPDLRFESSDTWDLGFEWIGPSARLDMTYFATKVNDRITAVTTYTPPPGAPPTDAVIASFANANDADLRGVELDARWQFSSRLAVFANWNHYFERKETVGGVSREIYNVAESAWRAGVDAEIGALSGRLSARYVGERIAQDFNQNPVAEVDYPDFLTVDMTLRYQLTPQQMLTMDIGNLLDEEYYEVLGYTLAGRHLMLRYRYSL